MQISAHTVAGVVLHNTEPIGLDVVLNGTGNVQKGVTGSDLAQPCHQRFLGDTTEDLGLGRRFTNTDGDAAVAVVSVEVSTGIHLQQITLVNHPFGTGNTVHHFVVDAGADACGKAVVSLEARCGTHLSDALLRKSIEVARRLAWLHHRHHLPQHRGNDAAGFAHDLDLTG